MSARQIIGICLVRNEDLFLGQALDNIAAFCDRIYVADTGSTDGTWALVQRRAALYPHLEVHRIAHPRQSHQLIEGYAGTPTWVFGVDGDELYDPRGLAVLRRDLLAGVYDASWRLIGNVLNCVRLDHARGLAAGYLAPPSRSITKLYHFGAITRWDRVAEERLHGGHLLFRAGYDATLERRLHEELDWEHSPLRCLHVCFLPRSTLDRPGRRELLTRWNLADHYSRGPLGRTWGRLLRRLGVAPRSAWKQERYGRGPLVEKEIADFFPTEPAGP